MGALENQIKMLVAENERLEGVLSNKEQKTNQAVYHPKGQYQVIDDSQRMASHGLMEFLSLS